MPGLRTASLALLLMLAPAMLGACVDGDEEPDSDEGSRLLDDTMGDGPRGDDRVDPTGPGFEPPVTGMEPAAGDPTSTPPPAATPGSTDGNAGQMAPSDAVDDADADADAGSADATSYSCDDFPACGASGPCAGELHCIVLPFCGDRPGCIDPARACTIECGAPGCAILESYPEQLGCD